MNRDEKRQKQTDGNRRTEIESMAACVDDILSRMTIYCSSTITSVIKERDAALEELNSVERSFSDLHRRYDKMKTLIEGYQRNEESLKVQKVCFDWKISFIGVCLVAGFFCNLFLISLLVSDPPLAVPGLCGGLASTLVKRAGEISDSEKSRRRKVRRGKSRDRRGKNKGCCRDRRATGWQAEILVSNQN